MKPSSTNGGKTWQQLEKGLPELMGEIGVAASPAQPDRVWAQGGKGKREDEEVEVLSV